MREQTRSPLQAAAAFSRMFDVSSKERDPDAPLPLVGNFPFVLKHHESNWEIAVVGGVAVWLPILTPFVLMPGCHGIKATKRGIDAGLTKTRDQENGWTFLDPRKLDYTDSRPALRGGTGTYFFEKWATPHVSGKKVSWSYDFDAFAQWRYDLVVDGLIDPPSEHVIEQLARIQERRAGRRAKEVHIPTVAEHVKAERAKLVLMQTTPLEADEGTAGAIAEGLARRAEEPRRVRSRAPVEEEGSDA